MVNLRKRHVEQASTPCENNSLWDSSGDKLTRTKESTNSAFTCWARDIHSRSFSNNEDEQYQARPLIGRRPLNWLRNAARAVLNCTRGLVKTVYGAVA